MATAPTLATLSPMLLEEAQKPFSDPGWAFEVKYDGYRVLAEFGGVEPLLKSRNATDMTRWFPEVVATLASLAGGRHVVDGEVCVLNEHGTAGDAEFQRLFKRAARRGYKPGDDVVTLVVFDLLVHKGRSVMGKPWKDRKKRLADLLGGDVQFVRIADHVVGEGMAMYQAAVRLELEGIVAKRMDSVYQAGVRSWDWLKVKRPGAVPAERFRHRNR